MFDIDDKVRIVNCFDPKVDGLVGTIKRITSDYCQVEFDRDGDYGELIFAIALNHSVHGIFGLPFEFDEIEKI